jgi:hypothetical protein
MKIPNYKKKIPVSHILHMNIFRAANFENEIEEPPPNMKEYFILVEEMNIEKNDEQDHVYKKEDYFQDIFDESRALEVVVNKEKDECILMSKTLQPIIDFIELWF